MSANFTNARARRTGYAPGTNAGAGYATGGRPQADDSGWPIQQQVELQHAEQVPPGNPPATPPQTPPPSGQQQQHAGTFTQADLDRIAAQARDEGRRAGMTEAEKKAADDRAAADAKALADQQQFKPLYETAQQTLAQQKASFKEATIRTAVTQAAAAKGFHNPAIALSLVDKAKAEVNETDWTMSNADVLIAELVTAHPYLVKDGGTSGQGGQGAQGGQLGGDPSVYGYGPNAYTPPAGQQQARPIPGTPNAGGNGNGAPTISDERRAHIEQVKQSKRNTDPRYRNS